MKAILAIYLTNALGFTQNTSTIIVHLFNFFVYLFSLAGGIISDCWLGKYQTIVQLSIIYVIGTIILSISSLAISSSLNPSNTAILGLGLIALGTGGIKPCVSSFGGDQIDVHDLDRVSKFFAIFYFIINAGSVLSMLITPILRKDAHCFGKDSCYPLAFGIPSILMVAALVIFMCGKSLYRQVASGGTSVVEIWSIYRIAFKKRRNSFDKSLPLLDYAKSIYPPLLVDRVKDLQRVIIILLPSPVFWALFDQQSSKWIFQATQMNSTLFGYAIMPEQMQLLNAILILLFIPIFEKVIYPVAKNLGCRCTSMQKISAGMVLGILSFCAASILQLKIDKSTFIFDNGKNKNQTTSKCIKNCVNISWQTPQYILITFGEIMFSITGLEFAYSQAPETMKSFCQSFWLITVAFGNLIVVLITWLNPFERFGILHSECYNYLLYAGLLLTALIVFQVISKDFHRSSVEQDRNYF